MSHDGVLPFYIFVILAGSFDFLLSKVKDYCTYHHFLLHLHYLLRHFIMLSGYGLKMFKVLIFIQKWHRQCYLRLNFLLQFQHCTPK